MVCHPPLLCLVLVYCRINWTLPAIRQSTHCCISFADNATNILLADDKDIPRGTVDRRLSAAGNGVPNPTNGCGKGGGQCDVPPEIRLDVELFRRERSALLRLSRLDRGSSWRGRECSDPAAAGRPYRYLCAPLSVSDNVTTDVEALC